MLWARLPVIVLTLLFGLVVFAFARDLAGPVGGLVALALYAFSPDVIAHGSLATLDVPAAGFLLTSVWLLWRARLRPRLYLPLAGAALGAAVATKMSALPAVPVLLLLAVLSVWYARRTRGTGRRGTARLLALGVAAAVAVALVAVAVVWATYLAVDPRLRWAAPDGRAGRPRAARAAVDWLPFPRAVPGRDAHPVRLRGRDVERLPVRPALPRLALVLPAGRAAGEDPARACSRSGSPVPSRSGAAPAAARGAVRARAPGRAAGRGA